MKFARLFFIPAACTAALIACHHESDGEARALTSTGAAVSSVANTTAVDRIADARCARESTCNNVGSGQRYASIESCTEKARGDVLSDLNANDCPGGVAQDYLNSCVAAIQAESCGNVLDKVERITACRTGALCLKH